jgi:uncharacterized protein involved in exopolysaccharide biosynthesis
MAKTPFELHTRPAVTDDGGDLIDWRALRDWAGFTLRATFRHAARSVVWFAVVLGVGLGTVLALPKTYKVESSLLALRNPVISSLSNPTLWRPQEQDAPTRAARETILKRANLVALCEQTNLIERDHASRAPATRLVDWAVRLIARRDPTPDEQMDAMVSRLQKHLRVDVKEGSVTIALEWPEAQAGYDLVQAAMKNFLEARRSTEISMVQDAISVLEARSTTIRRQIDGMMDQLRARMRSTARANEPRTVVRRVPAPARPRTEDPEMTRLEALLNGKRRALVELEDFRQRRIAELQAQLTQARSVFSDQHPSVMATRQSIESLSVPSPQIETLRREVMDLEAEYRARARISSLGDLAAPFANIVLDPVISPGGRVEEDPRTEYERGQLRQLFGSYTSLLERIDQARMEMDTAEAAFKYRYGIITPPLIPKAPSSPRMPLAIAASVLAALLAAVLAAVLADIRSGLVVESWQVARKLELPLLAEIEQ